MKNKMLIGLVFVSVFTFGTSGVASEVACKSQSIRAALSLYLKNASGIQGHEYTPDFISSKIQANKIFNTVNVDGNNDEGASWTTTFEVELSKRCKVLSVKQTKNCISDPESADEEGNIEPVCE
jgi:hypothetical protein